MQLMNIAAFVLTVAAQLRCISSSSVHAPGLSPGFLETSSEIDTSAILARVENVGSLASDERVAVQAQQQALVALEQEQIHLASRMDALEAQRSTDKALEAQPLNAVAHDAESQELFYLCSKKTEGTCVLYDCDKSRGMVVCEGGACTCQPGICADGHGRCLSDKPGRKLPGTHLIRIEKDGSYMHMDKKEINFAKRREQDGPDDNLSKKEFDKGHWHVVVNNDDSLMLWTDKYGPVNFLTIEDINDDKDDPKWRVVHKPFTSPWAVSWEVHGKKNGEVWLKHIRSKQWLTPNFPLFPMLQSPSLKGSDSFPGRAGALIFDPNLKGVKLKASAQHILPMWPLLLIIGVQASM